VDSLGFVLAMLERYEEALPYLHEAEEVLTLSGRMDDLIKNQERLGIAYKELGDRDKVSQSGARRDEAGSGYGPGPKVATVAPLSGVGWRWDRGSLPHDITFGGPCLFG
jgi:hypothetical protein